MTVSYWKAPKVIKFIKHYFESKDSRGSITGLINSGSWQEINVIESKAGITRGGHYHRNTVEAFIILAGKIEIELRDLAGNTEKLTVKKNDVFIIPVNTVHSFHCITNSKWINMLSIKHDPDNPDFHQQ